MPCIWRLRSDVSLVPVCRVDSKHHELVAFKEPLKCAICIIICIGFETLDFQTLRVIMNSSNDKHYCKLKTLTNGQADLAALPRRSDAEFLTGGTAALVTRIKCCVWSALPNLFKNSVGIFLRDF